MNIFTKIKNWLIHKLGGYTEEEHAEVVDYAEEPWFELAKEYHDKYTAEHEAYLALLNCHNATAEAAQSTLVPVEMAKAIKAYCKGMDYCENCDLMGESGLCKINGVPCHWEVE